MTQGTSPDDPVKAVDLSPEEVAFYEREGYLFVPGLVSEETAAALRAEVVRVMAAAGIGPSKLQQTKQYLAGSLLDRYVHSPNLVALAGRLMGGPATLHSPFTAVKGIGGSEFHWHQDNQYTRFEGPGINLWTALEEMSPANGCLSIEPRSHLAGTRERVEGPDRDGHHTVERAPERVYPVRMRTGDCIAFSRLTVHGSGPNRSGRERVAYAVQFFRNDTKSLHPDGEWRLLKEFPRIDAPPLDRIVREDSP